MGEKVVCDALAARTPKERAALNQRLIAKLEERLAHAAFDRAMREGG